MNRERLEEIRKRVEIAKICNAIPDEEGAGVSDYYELDVVELMDYVEELERINGNYRRVIEALPNGESILKAVDK